jgi:DNA repair exonuclease SbcCD ATPase subunit
MIAEHHQALGDLETSKRDALAALRAQLAQTTAEQRRLAARVEDQESERDRMIAERHQALGDLETSKHDALAAMRAQLAQTTAKQTELIARVEQQQRDVERVDAEHRSAIADLETGRRQALAECERVLTEVQQELRVRDQVSAEIERRLLEVIARAVRRETIDEAAREEAHRARTTDLRAELTQVASETPAVLTDVEPLYEVFDAADETFVSQLIRIDKPAPQAADRKAPVFDAEDDAFVRGLIESNHAAADGEPTQELPDMPPSLREDV